MTTCPALVLISLSANQYLCVTEMRKRITILIPAIIAVLVLSLGSALYSMSMKLDELRENIYLEKLGQLGIALRLVSECLGAVIYGVEHLGEADVGKITIYISQNLHHAQNYLYFAKIPTVSRGDPHYDMLLETTFLVSDLDTLLGVLDNKIVGNRTYVISFLRTHLDSFKELKEELKHISIAYIELSLRKHVDLNDLEKHIVNARRVATRLIEALG